MDLEKKILLSIIISTRNDSYGGNSVWRLETALNFFAKNAKDLDILHQVEIIVADWGSQSPIRKELKLIQTL